jgi:alkylhydroperoxidase family enzyme
VARIPVAPVEELDPFLRKLHDEAREDDWSTKHCARAFASHPRLLEKYLEFYYPYHAEGVLPLRLKELVRLRIATLNGCQTCKAARLAQEHLTEDEALAVDGYQGAGYTDREKLAIRYAEAMAVDHHSIDDSFLREVREEFGEKAFLELTMMAGQYIGFGRMLAILQLETVACPI